MENSTEKFPHHVISFSTLWKLLNRDEASLRDRPVLMGILNLTPDSFSDGGRFLDPDAALEQALRLEADGADLLDIGAESTRPGHDPVPEEEELNRLLPVLDRLAGNLDIPLSVDTSKAAVAQAAFEHGAAILNDVAALSRPGMLDFARAIDAPVVFMHGVARTLDPEDTLPSQSIADWFAGQMPALGIAPERILLDPGIGFGTTRAQDAAILQDLSPLKALGRPRLIGLSRKRIVRQLHPGQDPDAASAEMSLEAWKQGATIHRLHELNPFQQLLAEGGRP